MNRLSIVLFLVLILNFFVMVPAYGGSCEEIPVGEPYDRETDRAEEESWTFKEPLLPFNSMRCYLITMTRFKITYDRVQPHLERCYCNVTGQWEFGPIYDKVLASGLTKYEKNETDRDVIQCCEPPSPPECPLFEPQNPGIASKAHCRGACGGDCPGKPIKVLRYVQSGDCYYKCSYDKVWVCGTHRCCREHDACYDRCASAGRPALCRRGCDSKAFLCARDSLSWYIPPGIRDTIALGMCASWARGHGPFDRYLTFSDPPIRFGPFFGPCPS